MGILQFATRAINGQKLKIGFIGLGQMGYPMASNLVQNINPALFVIHDIFSESTKRFQNEHQERLIKIVNTPAQVAQECSVIITMLPASAHVKSVYLGENGILSSIKSGSMIMDSSTIDPSTTKEMACILLKKDVHILDTPVSGGKILSSCYYYICIKNFRYARR